MLRLLLVIFCIQSGLTATAQFKNSKLADLEDGVTSPTGVSIAINNRDVKNLVAGIGANRMFTSNDGGKTWIESGLEGSFGAGGDPFVMSDAKGNFHYFHLSDPNGKGRGDDGWLDRLVCHSSNDGEDGVKWGKGASIGINPPKDQAHPRATRHYELNGIYLAWTQFDRYGSQDSTCQANILFSKSSHGKKWTDPVQINSIPGNCKGESDTPSGAMAAINTNNRLFVVWANHNKIYFDRSYTDGDTWLSYDLEITDQPGGASMLIPGIGRCSGYPTLAIDNSETYFQGSLYVTFADQRNGESNTDVWFTRSTNRGDSWTAPKRINKDTTRRHQFMPIMTVDQTTGIVYVIYYDRRAYSDLQTDVYLAYSLDGANHFSEVKISETPFTPSADKSIGDYIGISANKGLVAAIWTRADGNRNSVWTSIIRQEEIFKKEDMPKLQSTKRIPAATLRSTGRKP